MPPSKKITLSKLSANLCDTDSSAKLGGDTPAGYSREIVASAQGHDTPPWRWRQTIGKENTRNFIIPCKIPKSTFTFSKYM